MPKTKRTFGGNRKPIVPPSKQAKIDPSANKENENGVKRVFYVASDVEVARIAAANDVRDATSDEEDAEYVLPLRMTREDRQENGRLWASEEEFRIYLKVAYIYEFEEPAENEWSSILTI
jgi:hypothetical protein